MFQPILWPDTKTIKRFSAKTIRTKRPLIWCISRPFLFFKVSNFAEFFGVDIGGLSRKQVSNLAHFNAKIAGQVVWDTLYHINCYNEGITIKASSSSVFVVVVICLLDKTLKLQTFVPISLIEDCRLLIWKKS